MEIAGLVIAVLGLIGLIPVGYWMSYGQIWCMPMNSSGDLVRLLDLFSVNEFHTFNDLRQIRETA